MKKQKKKLDLQTKVIICGTGGLIVILSTLLLSFSLIDKYTPNKHEIEKETNLLKQQIEEEKKEKESEKIEKSNTAEYIELIEAPKVEEDKIENILDTALKTGNYDYAISKMQEYNNSYEFNDEEISIKGAEIYALDILNDYFTAYKKDKSSVNTMNFEETALSYMYYINTPETYAKTLFSLPTNIQKEFYESTDSLVMDCLLIDSNMAEFNFTEVVELIQNEHDEYESIKASIHRDNVMIKNIYRATFDYKDSSYQLYFYTTEDNFTFANNLYRTDRDERDSNLTRVLKLKQREMTNQ